jgi:hypothetical protein
MAAALLRKILETPYWTFYAALSILFLLLGAWAGVLAAGWLPFQAILGPERSEDTAPADALPANGQRNLLVIGVDSLEVDLPVLESLWLVLYFPGRNPVTLMPLYPQPGEPETSQETGLEKAFSLEGSGGPSPAFFEQLRHEQVWWTGYVLLDETAAAALLDQLGGLEVNGSQLDGLQALTNIPGALDDRTGALDGQSFLLRSACAQAGKRPSDWPAVASLAGELRHHLRTDADVSELVRGWLQAAGPAPTLECEFPLLPNTYLERTQ